MPPKVFLSHASEDKERFVLKFAKGLRERGIDAWVDKWEMLPGDSLVDKIFEEGIKQASAVIVILSKNSERKPWVIEELNAGYVKKINEKSKLIPVLIEDCEVPECLRSTLWVKIKNLNSYEAELESIAASILGINDKPALGNLPPYAARLSDHPSSTTHTKIDNAIVRISCEEAIRSQSYFINAEKIFFDSGKPIFPENELIDSIKYLGEYGFFELTHYLSEKIPKCEVTISGFELYARENIENYNATCESVISCILNKESKSAEDISENVGESEFIVKHILKTLASGGLINITEYTSGEIQIYDVSSSLRRRLKS